MRGLHRKLLRDFKTMGLQVLTIAVLIVGGISVLISSWSSFQSLENSKEAFYQEFRFPDVFAELVRAPNSLLSHVGAIAGVDRAESRIVKEGLVEVPGQAEPALGRFVSYSVSRQNLNLIYLRNGRMPEASSIIETVVHEAFASSHKLKVGDKFSCVLGGKRHWLLVSGVGLSPESIYSLSPAAPLPDDKHFGIFWIRQEDMESMTGLEGSFNSVQIRILKGASIGEIKRRLDLILQPYGAIQSYDRSGQMSHIFVEDEIRQQRTMAIVMPSIFMSVAVFILNVILSRMISLQRAQIATLKSLGYRSRSLVVHYFQLVSAILFVGIVPSIIIGAAIGNWYAGLYRDFFRFPSIDFTLSGPAVVIGVMAGFIPGWIGSIGALTRVFTLKPAEALRPPSPPRFQGGVFDRLGLLKGASVISKMTVRTFFFRPLRTTFNLLGIAAALAILINGSFWKDVVDFMMDRQFREMHREDLSVQLANPRKPAVLNELLHIPGVMMVEGERRVPVTLRFKNFKKEVTLLGLDGNSKMSRVLDFDGVLVRPEPNGVFLSRYFESEFAIRSGDSVELKVLGVNSRLFQVKVLGFVDDLIGHQAYARRNDLHRWLMEEPVIDTVLLRADPRTLDRVYVELMDRPEVAGISARRLMLKGFQETMGGMIVTFTFILIVFAMAIAGAVLYNSARIGFSERAWELASLRIIGYGSRSVFELLFFDLSLQVIVALIPGIGLGYWLCFLSTNMIHNDTFKFPLVIETSTYATAVLVLMMTLAMSSVFLFFKVKRLNFSDALKARE